MPFDVDREAALPVLVGDRRAAHQVDDRRGVEDGVDALDGGGDGLGSQMSPSTTSQPRMSGERGRRAVEGADLVPTVEQFGHQVGADEAGASGDQHTAEFGGREEQKTRVNVESPMPQSINETCYSFDSLGGKSFRTQLSSSSLEASASSTRLRAPAKCSSQRLASSSPLSQSFSDASRVQPTLLQLLHDFDQLVAGFFVPQFTNRLHSLPSLTAVTAPSATRTRNRVPAGASAVVRKIAPAAVCTTA